MLSYDVGLDEARNWETDPYGWMLISSGIFSRVNATVADVLGVATEVSVAGYARIAVPVRSLFLGRYQYQCADPDFGALGPGETPIAFLLFKDNGSDATNVPMGWYPKATPQRTDELNPFKAQLNSGRALVLSATQFQ
jgi:hypothetical protein